MAYCSACGHLIPNEARFCRSCGAPQDVQESQTNTAANQPANAAPEDAAVPQEPMQVVTKPSSEDAKSDDQSSTVAEGSSRESTNPAYQVSTFSNSTTDTPTPRGRRKKVLILGGVILALVVLGFILKHPATQQVAPSSSSSSSASSTAAAAEDEAARNEAARNEAARIASHYEGFNHYQMVGVGRGDHTLFLNEKSREHTIDSMDIKEIACQLHLDQDLFHTIRVHKLNSDDVTYHLPLQHTDGSYVECPGEAPPDLPHKSQWSYKNGGEDIKPAASTASAPATPAVITPDLLSECQNGNDNSCTTLALTQKLGPPLTEASTCTWNKDTNGITCNTPPPNPLLDKCLADDHAACKQYVLLGGRAPGNPKPSITDATVCSWVSSARKINCWP